MSGRRRKGSAGLAVLIILLMIAAAALGVLVGRATSGGKIVLSEQNADNSGKESLVLPENDSNSGNEEASSSGEAGAVTAESLPETESAESSRAESAASMSTSSDAARTPAENAGSDAADSENTEAAESVSAVSSSASEASSEAGADAASGENAGQAAAGGGGAAAASGEDAWMLLLVNSTHPVPEGYEIPEFTELRGKQQVDSRIYPDLQKMFDDARAQDILPKVNSGYRSAERQQELLDAKIASYKEEGLSKEEAEKKAAAEVALPGTSEHQTGLSVDITTADWEKQTSDIVFAWMNEHSWEYGFIQRYPENKQEITGIVNEPWHYRYVGKKAAKEMHESGQCLEEYLGAAG